MGSVIILHVAELGLIPGFLYGPLDIVKSGPST